MAPMIDGPTYPPRLATELIKAMPDAAENPVRNRLGIEHREKRAKETVDSHRDQRPKSD
jgi:hypothetical protein